MFKFKFWSLSSGCYKIVTVDRETIKTLNYNYYKSSDSEKLQKIFRDGFKSYVKYVMSYQL